MVAAIFGGEALSKLSKNPQNDFTFMSDRVS